MIAIRRIRIHTISVGRIRGFAATATVLLLAGCAASTPVGAGVRSHVSPRVLTFANGNDDVSLPLIDWSSQVRKSSGGTLTIDFKSSWRLGQSNSERGALQDVKAGKVDMAWIGARAFDKVGVRSFQALLAPLLVDSYALESKVFEEGIPDRMLTGIGTIGLKGVGVLPGPLRKVLGVSKPFRATTDFKAQVVGIQDSGVAESTLRALGAEPRAVPSSAKLTGLDASEQQLGSIAGNSYQSTAKYVTTNLNLWPRPLVLVINPKVLGSLNPAQQAVLRAAAKATTSGAITNARAEDTSAVTLLCQGGMTLTEASPGALAKIRTALGSVYQ
jgi:TRAP-type C4-dicarboxylate transport system substrate-binding protein